MHNGYQYCTNGEYRMATLLDKQGIAFTPDVQFCFRNDARCIVADFVFNKDEYLWTGVGPQQVIHGIEVKGKIDGKRGGIFKPAAVEKIELLKKERGINILLLSNAQVRVYWARGELPLKLIKKAGT